MTISITAQTIPPPSQCPEVLSVVVNKDTRVIRCEYLLEYHPGCEDMPGEWHGAYLASVDIQWRRKIVD